MPARPEQRFCNGCGTSLAASSPEVTGGDRILRNEVFDVDNADQALARFAELCADLEGTTQ